MLGERMPLAELCPGLETEAVLTAYCRGRTGLLADDGARWAAYTIFIVTFLLLLCLFLFIGILPISNYFLQRHNAK